MPRNAEMQVTAGGAALAGTLTLPDAPPPADRRGRYPNVLLLPSWLPRTRDGGFDRSRHPEWFAREPRESVGVLKRLAEALAAHGVASLRCDPRGSGASDGEWQSTSLFTRIDDARDMLAAMRSHGALDLRRTGLVGHGQGATLALSVAIGDPAVSALTLVGPSARSQRDVLRRGVAERARTGVDQQHPLVAALDWWSEDLVERAQRHEPEGLIQLWRGSSVHLELAAMEQEIHTPNLALATMLHRSVTVAVGSRDVWAHPDEGSLLAEALRDAGNRPRLDVVDGAGHDLDEAGDGVMDELARDLASRLEPRDLPPVLLAIEEMDDAAH
jgi:pimeloyl-ACP methyl ester carboxylesterase